LAVKKVQYQKASLVFPGRTEFEEIFTKAAILSKGRRAEIVVEGMKGFGYTQREAAVFLACILHQ
jgi:hypothetical protein